MVFCNKTLEAVTNLITDVTILILIDGFLQYDEEVFTLKAIKESQSLF